MKNLLSILLFLGATCSTAYSQYDNKPRIRFVKIDSVTAYYTYCSFAILPVSRNTNLFFGRFAEGPDYEIEYKTSIGWRDNATFRIGTRPDKSHSPVDSINKSMTFSVPILRTGEFSKVGLRFYPLDDGKVHWDKSAIVWSDVLSPMSPSVFPEIKLLRVVGQDSIKSIASFKIIEKDTNLPLYIRAWNHWDAGSFKPETEWAYIREGQWEYSNPIRCYVSAPRALRLQDLRSGNLEFTNNLYNEQENSKIGLQFYTDNPEDRRSMKSEDSRTSVIIWSDIIP